MVKKDIIVTPFFGNWAVKLKGKDQPISTHNLKSEAIKVAKQVAKRLNSEIIIDEKGNKKLLLKLADNEGKP